MLRLWRGEQEERDGGGAHMGWSSMVVVCKRAMRRGQFMHLANYAHYISSGVNASLARETGGTKT